MDVKTAFFNENLEDEIYMDQPISLYQKVRMTKFVILNDQFLVPSSLPEHGILDSIKTLSLLA